MVWAINCIVFIWVVVIQFYPKSCNYISVFNLFSEKSSEGSTIWILKINGSYKVLRTIKMYKIHFKFQVIARWKNARKRDENWKN